MTKTRLYKAAIPHYCNSCSETITPGEVYLKHVASPGHADLHNDTWLESCECEECARRYGRGSLFEKRREKKFLAFVEKQNHDLMRQVEFLKRKLEELENQASRGK